MDQQAIASREDQQLYLSDYKNSKSESSGSDDASRQQKEWKCACLKTYSRQSSLFNHIKIKHKNQKDQFQIKANAKPGRPKNAEGKDKQGGIKSEKKILNQPSCVSDLDWAIITSFSEKSQSELFMVVMEDLDQNHDQGDSVELPQDCQSFFNEIVKTAELTNQEIDDLVNLTKSFGLIVNVIIPNKRVHNFANYTIAAIIFAFDFSSKRQEQSEILKDNINYDAILFTKFQEIIRKYNTTNSDNSEYGLKEKNIKVSTEKSAKKQLQTSLELKSLSASAPEIQQKESGCGQEGMQGFQNCCNPNIRFHSQQQFTQPPQNYQQQQQQQQFLQPAINQQTNITFKSDHVDYPYNQDNRIYSFPQQTIEQNHAHIHPGQIINMKSRNNFEEYQQKYLKTNEYSYIEDQHNTQNYPQQQKECFYYNHYQPNPQIPPNTVYQSYIDSAPPAYSEQQFAENQRITAQNKQALNITNQDDCSQSINQVVQNYPGEQNLLHPIPPFQNNDYQGPYQEYPDQSIKEYHINADFDGNNTNKKEILHSNQNDFQNQELNSQNIINQLDQPKNYFNYQINQFEKQYSQDYDQEDVLSESLGDRLKNQL